MNPVKKDFSSRSVFSLADRLLQTVESFSALSATKPLLR
jgi:hypothetical protein